MQLTKKTAKLNSEHFPKTIWFLWVQGFSNAPLVVRKCYESWLRHNPGWEIILLDENNIHDYFPVKTANFTPVVLSEVLRVNLLAKYGGIWVDATCFCLRPLNDWIFDVLGNGFFVFDRPGNDRMISSWFMAAGNDSYILLEYQKAVNHFWEVNPQLKLIDSTKWAWLSKYLQRFDTPVWFSSVITKVLKVHPYFWFHYLFRQLYLADDKFKNTWDSIPKISADVPHAPQIKGLLNPLDAQMKADIDNRISPVYKLTWKYDQAADISGTIFDYILKLKS